MRRRLWLLMVLVAVFAVVGCDDTDSADSTTLGVPEGACREEPI
jgi:hypothetical protein